MGCKKQGAKNKVIVIQKEKRQPGLFSFWITMTLFFCTLLFAKSRVPNFLKVPDPKKISGRPDKLEYWVQIDSATVISPPIEYSFPMKSAKFWYVRYVKWLSFFRCADCLNGYLLPMNLMQVRISEDDVSRLSCLQPVLGLPVFLGLTKICMNQIRMSEVISNQSS